MRISGFSMCRNAEKLYYPIKESILSVLPLVDEFVIAIGKGDDDDRTLELVRSIDSEKIRIIETKWDLEAFPNGTIHAQQTDLAKAHCSGDWLIYLQADEVIHEQDYSEIKEKCTTYLNDLKVEAFILKYRHFWGDYQHYIDAHGWYKKEIRIIRNSPDIHSWESAQSFRSIPAFDGKSYRQKPGSRKLNALEIEAYVYHYGWVRPPSLMTAKMKALDKNHSRKSVRFEGDFEYGDLSKLSEFKGSHPAVMSTWIDAFNWEDQLDYQGAKMDRVYRFKHEKIGNRILSWIENHLFNGRELFGFKNYEDASK